MSRTPTSPAVLWGLNAGAQKSTVKRGQVVFRQGDTSDGIYLVINGHVSLTCTDARGRQATVAVLGRNELFGEQCLLYGLKTRLLTARATTQAEVLKISLGRVRNLLATDIEFANFVLNRVVSRVAQYEQALTHFVVNNTERRLVRALLHLAKDNATKTEPVVIENVSQEMLAEMVGASRPRINGFMTKFRRLGHVEYAGTRIIVKPSLVSVLFQDEVAIAREARRQARLSGVTCDLARSLTQA